jgi:LysR family transcriptional regulator, hydrogen peroxide-inducible genes activator
VPTLRQLEYLVAVADARHFRKAAQKVNATQPTLSGQLKVMEDRLGVQLVDRSRSNIVLTPVGKKIAEVARRMLADSRTIRQIASGDPDGAGLSGVTRLGLPPTIGPYLLPQIIPALRRRYQHLKLYVREDLPQVLTPGLDDETYDVIIAPLPLSGDDIQAVPLFREPLFVVVAYDHAFASLGTVDRARLRDEELLTLGPGHQLHDAVAGLAAETGARLRADYEGTSLDSLREMVATGLGITILPALYTKSALANDESVRVLQLSGVPLERTIGIAWRASSSRAESYAQLATALTSIISAEFGDLPKIG